MPFTTPDATWNCFLDVHFNPFCPNLPGYPTVLRLYGQKFIPTCSDPACNNRERTEFSPRGRADIPGTRDVPLQSFYKQAIKSLNVCIVGIIRIRIFLVYIYKLLKLETLIRLRVTQDMIRMMCNLYLSLPTEYL